MNLFDQIPAMRADLAHVAATVAALGQIDHVVRHQRLHKWQALMMETNVSRPSVATKKNWWCLTP